jgi:hypothetical protein
MQQSLLIWKKSHTCVIGCCFYERVTFQKLRDAASLLPCRTVGKGEKDCSLDKSLPSVEVYMLKIFMSLVMFLSIFFEPVNTIHK